VVRGAWLIFDWPEPDGHQQQTQYQKTTLARTRFFEASPPGPCSKTGTGRDLSRAIGSYRGQNPNSRNRRAGVCKPQGKVSLDPFIYDCCSNPLSHQPC
jgi:hypothetical protein